MRIPRRRRPTWTPHGGIQGNYQGQASAYETEVLPERDSSHLDQITSPSPKKKSRRILRAAVITAACIVILCGAASAFGFDILQAFADWTAETLDL